MAPTVHPPPAGIDDFARRPDTAEAMAQGWDAIVNDWLDGAAGYYGDETNPSLFYNAQRDETPGAGATDDAVWDAFPLAITKWFAGDDDPERTRWRAADTPRAYPGRYRRVVDGRLGEPIDLTHRQQDEYCEWFAVRDGEAIRRITFTSEAPEYWMYLAHGTPEFLPQGHPDHDRFAGDMSLVEELYQEHVDPSATVQDLTWPYDVAQAVSTRHHLGRALSRRPGRAGRRRRRPRPALPRLPDPHLEAVRGAQQRLDERLRRARGQRGTGPPGRPALRRREGRPEGHAALGGDRGQPRH